MGRERGSLHERGSGRRHDIATQARRAADRAHPATRRLSVRRSRLMHLSPRHRLVIAMLLSWPIGLVYFYWALINGLNVIRWYRSGFVSCSSTWMTITNGCDPSTYSVTFAWVQLIVVTAIVLALGLMVARWVLRPVAQMAETVARLGPASLGVRLKVAGRDD